MLDRSRLPARMQYELKTPRSDPLHVLIVWVLGFLAAILFIVGGIFFLAMVDRPGIGRSKRLGFSPISAAHAVELLASRDVRYGEPRCVVVKPVAVIAWGYLLENGEIVPFDEARPSAGGTFYRCTRWRMFQQNSNA